MILYVCMKSFRGFQKEINRFQYTRNKRLIRIIIMNINWTDTITNEDLWRITHQKSIKKSDKKKKMELDWTHIT